MEIKGEMKERLMGDREMQEELLTERDNERFQRGGGRARGGSRVDSERIKAKQSRGFQDCNRPCA